MSVILRLTGRILGSGVRLAEVPVADGPVWIQVAKAGIFKGYRGGELVLSAEFFAKVVANFRSHPAYEAGPDGVGTAKVVPFDYEHASEMEPTKGSIPTTGAPAPAWAIELDIRDGADGPELWSLTDLTPQAREQIRAGGYQWTSVAIWENAVHPVTGAKIGPVLTSVAFTNKPFIQGMAPMQAKVDVWGEAESPEEVILGLREVLGLDGTADATMVLNELADLGAAYNEGRRLPGCPEGVGHLIDRVRRLVGMRALATAEEIIQAAGQALASASQPTQPPTSEPPGTDMADSSLNAKLATIYGVRDKDEAILAAAEKAKGSEDAYDKLAAMIGASDFQDALTQVAKLQEKAKSHEEMLPLYQAMQQRLAEGDKKDAEEEVEQVAASLGVSGDAWTRLKPLLLAERIAAASDPKKLAAFRQQYPLPTPEQRLLSNPQVAGPNGLQLGGPATGYTPATKSASTHPLDGFPGPNRVIKARAYLSEKKPGFLKLSDREQVFEAGNYLRQGAPVL
jgi:hypothetical protein